MRALGHWGGEPASPTLEIPLSKTNLRAQKRFSARSGQGNDAILRKTRYSCRLTNYRERGNLPPALLQNYCENAKLLHRVRIPLGSRILFMDAWRPFSYLTGLLNRMVITAITASPFIRDVKKKRQTSERPTSLLWN
jgi:hypothetical protein